MGLEHRTVTAEFVEYVCDECQKGVYRVLWETQDRSFPRRWWHRCSNCGHETGITAVYPMVKYKGKHFMLAEHVRDGMKNPPPPGCSQE